MGFTFILGRMGRILQHPLNLEFYVNEFKVLS